MKSIITPTFSIVFSLLLTAGPVLALNAATYSGCYSSSNPLKDQGSYQYQSSGYCQQTCAGLNMAVMGTTTGSNCYCGNQLPSADSKVSDSECNTPCFGYNQQNCGGSGTWSVSLTGTQQDVPNIQGLDSSSQSSSPSSTSTSQSSSASPSPSSSTSSTSGSLSSQTTEAPIATTTQKQSPSVVTVGNTVVVTAPGQTQEATPSSSPSPISKSSGSNKAGIAVGVVVGIIAICAIIGGLYFFLRQRRRRALEEGHRKNIAISDFGRGPNGKISSAASTSDSRIEPSIMMQRRQSDGSIADNQDYSRRILKVTNPDGT